MKFALNKPCFMLESDEKKRYGLIWIVEILVFFAVMSAGSVITAVIIMVPTAVWIYRELFSIVEQYANDLDGFFGSFTDIITKMIDSMPDWLVLLQLFATVGTIAAVILYCRLIEKRPIRTLGFSKKGGVFEYLIGLLIGLIMFFLAVLIGVFTGTLKIEGINPNFSPIMFLLFFLGFAVQSASEEMLCRGYFMTSFSKKYPLIAGVLINSAIFAVLHLANTGISILAIVNLFLCGVFFSLYVIKSGNLWGACAAHAMWNFAQGCIFGIKVSGINCGDSLFVSSTSDALTFINGGSFGIEGGIACTFVQVLGILILFFMKGKEQKTAFSTDI